MLRNVVGINSWIKNLRNLLDVWSFPLRCPTLRHFRSVRVVLHSDFPSFHLPSHHHQLQIFHVQSGKTDERVDELNDDYGTQDVIIALPANGGTRENWSGDEETMRSIIQHLETEISCLFQWEYFNYWI